MESGGRREGGKKRGLFVLWGCGARVSHRVYKVRDACSYGSKVAIRAGYAYGIRDLALGVSWFDGWMVGAEDERGKGNAETEGRGTRSLKEGASLALAL